VVCFVGYSINDPVLRYMMDALAAKGALKTPFRRREDDTETEAAERLKQCVDWELVLATDHVHSSPHDLADGER